jgi:hypothetical protein
VSAEESSYYAAPHWKSLRHLHCVVGRAESIFTIQLSRQKTSLSRLDAYFYSRLVKAD